MTTFQIRSTESQDHSWLVNFLTEHWGSTKMVARNRIHYVDKLPGFVAMIDGSPVGLATYCIESKECELVSFDSMKERIGIGSALLGALKDAAEVADCHRLWLTTTNDNTVALRFYQKRGFRLVALYRDAVGKAREMKPEIPLLGNDGIPITDEIDMELLL